MATKNSARTRRASRESSDQPSAALPIFAAAIERPITSAQLAEHLQLSERTIASYREQNRIPFWRINSRCIRYRLSDVERALNSNK